MMSRLNEMRRPNYKGCSWSVRFRGRKGVGMEKRY
jgi:hypothetical protein